MQFELEKHDSEDAENKIRKNYPYLEEPTKLAISLLEGDHDKVHKITYLVDIKNGEK
jgi:hypothetical protein